jgi:hypothetical protein
MLLFKRKSKKVKKDNFLRISLLDIHGEALFIGCIADISLPEQLIIEKSIEFFNDPNPCFIHRSAVNTRLICELEEILKELIEATSTASTDISPLGDYLGSYPDAVLIKSEEDQYA